MFVDVRFWVRRWDGDMNLIDKFFDFMGLCLVEEVELIR